MPSRDVGRYESNVWRGRAGRELAVAALSVGSSEADAADETTTAMGSDDDVEQLVGAMAATRIDRRLHYRKDGGLDMRFKSSKEEMARRHDRRQQELRREYWKAKREKEAWDRALEQLPPPPPDALMECAICLNSVQKSMATWLGCGHGFHRRCVERWAETMRVGGAAPSCPLCKTIIE